MVQKSEKFKILIHSLSMEDLRSADRRPSIGV